MTKMRYMPAPSPYTSPEQQADLERLIPRLRERRNAPGVTVIPSAEAAAVAAYATHTTDAGTPSAPIAPRIPAPHSPATRPSRYRRRDAV